MNVGIETTKKIIDVRTIKMKKRIIIPLLFLFSLYSFALSRVQLDSFADRMQNGAGSYNIGTIAITRNYAVAVYGDNGYCYEAAPQDLANRLKELNTDRKKIKDVHITESGKWVIVGDSIYWSDGIPTECTNAIMSLIDSKDYITCVSFDDYGNWVVLGTNSFYASPKIKQYMENARDRYGYLYYVNITNDAVIITCENGQFCDVGWNVPLIKTINEGLDKIDFRPKIIKLFPGVGCFIGNADVNRWSACF